MKRLLIFIFVIAITAYASFTAGYGIGYEAGFDQVLDIFRKAK
jgi:hypothetical protein